MVAYAGARRALIGGDHRSITFAGPSEALEEELYAGLIRTDDDLRQRALALKVPIKVEDGRVKVWSKGAVLVGEVSEVSATGDRRRRVYAAPGAFLIAEVKDGHVTVSGRGRSSCVVLGNLLTRRLANEAVRRAGARIDEGTLRAVMEEAAGKTASVSRSYTVLEVEEVQADPGAAVFEALREDSAKSGWVLCDRPSS